MSPRRIRAFVLAPAVILLAFQLDPPWKTWLQAALGALWLALAIFCKERKL